MDAQDSSKTGQKPFKLEDGVADAHVADALVTEHSENRALNLRWRQILRSETSRLDYRASLVPERLANLPEALRKRVVEGPDASEKFKRDIDAEATYAFVKAHRPETYVIKYYIVDDKTGAVPNQIIHPFLNNKSETISQVNADGSLESQQVPYIRSDNPVGPVNGNMQSAIYHAFDTIESQLPGRFRFERVSDPGQADISFAAVPDSDTMVGAATMESGGIMLSQSHFKGSLNADMQNTVLHEIGHALGLEHPHNMQKKAGSASTDNATYYDTVMTYLENDMRQPNGVAHSSYGLTYPTALMPSDLEALIKLYPIESDAALGGAQLGWSGNTAALNGVTISHVVNGKAVKEALRLPLAEGLVYQPMYDTSKDVLEIQTSVTEHIGFEKTERGLELIDKRTGGRTLVPVHIERLQFVEADGTVTPSAVTKVSPPEDVASAKARTER